MFVLYDLKHDRVTQISDEVIPDPELYANQSTVRFKCVETDIDLSENLIDSNVNNFVNNLFNNVTKYEEIHLSCIEKSKKYDWMKTANELESLYQQLV